MYFSLERDYSTGTHSLCIFEVLLIVLYDLVFSRVSLLKFIVCVRDGVHDSCDNVCLQCKRNGVLNECCMFDFDFFNLYNAAITQSCCGFVSIVQV